jgi:Lrp/AsnC family leucine-responsive transcriptional regulator
MADTVDITKLLDPIGWRILAELQDDARIHFSELGRRVGLSTPAVIERVHRMEEAGIITGYRVEIDRQKVGRPVCAFIRVRVGGDIDYTRHCPGPRDARGLQECHHIAGEDTFLLKVFVPTSEALETYHQKVHALCRNHHDARLVLARYPAKP